VGDILQKKKELKSQPSTFNLQPCSTNMVL